MADGYPRYGGVVKKGVLSDFDSPLQIDADKGEGVPPNDGVPPFDPKDSLSFVKGLEGK